MIYLIPCGRKRNKLAGATSSRCKKEKGCLKDLTEVNKVVIQVSKSDNPGMKVLIVQRNEETAMNQYIHFFHSTKTR